MRTMAAQRTYAMMVSDRMNLQGREAEMMRRIRFDPVDYKSRHGATTGAVPSCQVTVDNYKEIAEEEGRRIAEMDCAICCENIVVILSNGMKLYKLPECQHMVCSQCLVCMMIASEDEGDNRFKIVMINDDGTEQDVSHTITRNSQYTYAKCPQCR